jgi:hypothetical protein
MKRTLLRTLVAAGLVAGLIVPGAGAEADPASIHCVGTAAGTNSVSGAAYDYTDRCSASYTTIQDAVDAAGAGTSS